MIPDPMPLPPRFPLPARFLTAGAAFLLGILPACGGGSAGSAPAPGSGGGPALKKPGNRSVPAPTAARGPRPWKPAPTPRPDGPPPAIPGPLPFGLPYRIPVKGLKLPIDRGNPAAVKLARAFPKLRFASPLYLTAAPDGRDRVYVVEKAGRILIFKNTDAVTTSTVFLDIRNKVYPYGERGLLGLAFDPDYAKTGIFYVYYSTPGRHHSIVARYKVSATNPDLADPNSEEILIRLTQPYGNHNGGMIAFGPDKMLYIAFGDGGSGGDPKDNGQFLGNFFSTILRIDPHGVKTYRIPPDNPFKGNKKGWKEEIWAYGLRNPWRFSFDRLTKDLWCADVGQGAIEEIDLIVKGGNYGWRLYEGTRKYRTTKRTPPGPPIPPIFEYDHRIGRSITGGYVYRGRSAQNLRGAYVYGDYVVGQVWALLYDRKSRKVLSNTRIGRVPSVASFGEDRDGELFAISLGGSIFRFLDTIPGNGQIPGKLSATGLFENLAPLRPSPGILEFEVSSRLWSDGAVKKRFLALPGLARIGFREKEPWSFPIGTVLVKHFEIDTGGKNLTKLETRVLVHEKQGWAGYTYIWNAAGTEAYLSLTPKTAALKVRDPKAPGGFRNQTWDFPGSMQCLQCHTRATGWVVGPSTAQLNRDRLFGTVVDNQIRAWNHIGVFDRKAPNPTRLPALPSPTDPKVPLEKRVRSYLHANCAHCHRPGGPAPGRIDLRYDTPLSATRLIEVPPEHGSFGIKGARRIAKGSKERSILWRRMLRLDQERMPPLGSRVIDTEAVRMIGTWIDGLR